MRTVYLITVVLAVSSAAFCNSDDNVLDAFGTLPLYFIENRGQVDGDADFYVKGSDKTLFFTSEGVTFALAGNGEEEAKRWVVKLDFPDAARVKPKGENRQDAVFSYFKGKPEDWNRGIPVYSRLVYSDLWPGIDLVYSGTVNRLKYEFLVKPNADPGRIRLQYRGAASVNVNQDGILEVETPSGGFQDGKPCAYQLACGKRVDISMSYNLMEQAEDGACVIGFHVGAYDPSRPLVLDPVLLIYCGYIGGASGEFGKDIAVDKDGRVYITGYTHSDASSFPVKAGPDLSFNKNADAFVARISADGTGLEYCGYIGGAENDSGNGIAVGQSCRAYVVGETWSDASSFPVKGGPDKTFNGGVTDAFVALVNSQGTDLVYCGYIGGSANDAANSVDVDPSGRAYVTGSVESDASSFPVKGGPDLSYNGGVDGFVARVNTQGTDLEYCGYIGGSGIDLGRGIAVDSTGRACVTGSARSGESSFPVTVGPDLSFNGNSDAFVARVDAQGTALEYCGYIGGDHYDNGYDIAVDPDGRAYVTGSAQSGENTFPEKVGPDLYHNGEADAFVACVEADGTDLEYCGYIGGSNSDFGMGIAMDEEGRALVAGYTDSNESGDHFPVKSGPDLSYNGGFNDAFVARVSAQGTELEYCGYIGGSDNDGGNGIAVDSNGRAHVVGYASSDASTFPVHFGPDKTFNGAYEVFVAKVALELIADTYIIHLHAGGIVEFELDAGIASANRSYFILGSMTGTDPGFRLPGGLTIPLHFDLFTVLAAGSVHTPFLTDFQGKLDAAGLADAKLDTLGSLHPGVMGMKLYFAFTLYAPIDFVSNAVSVEIVP